MIDVERYPDRGTRLGRILRAPLALVPSRAIVPILQGPLRGCLWIVGSGIHRLWLGSYEPEKMRLTAQMVGAGDTVFDIGANVGIYTLLLARQVGPAGHVVAFEPLPRNVAFLQRHLRLNRLSNVSAIEMALGANEGSARFQTADDCSTGRVARAGPLMVGVTTLDQFVMSTGRVPSLLKIDVEGAELDVLTGGAMTLRQFRPRILLATHSANLATACTACLVRHGYDVQPLRRHGPAIDDEFLATPVEQQRQSRRLPMSVTGAVR